MDPAILPTVNAALNATSATLIVIGRYFISRRNVTAHRNLMLAAVATSTLFLASYLYYHFQVGSVRFTGQGPIRVVYFAILLSHTVLAMLIVPLVLASVTTGLRSRLVRHRAISRWTYPIWLYVSVTGVVIYVMLYHL